jgi:hypothetical protein
LHFYQSRWYDPVVGRFLQPDSIVPEPGNPQSLNRYAYVGNNPVKHTDPSGHWLETAVDIAGIAYDIYDIHSNGLNWENGLSLAADVLCAALPIAAGGGVAVRALMHADDAVDAVKAVNKAGDLGGAAIRAGEAVQDSAKLLPAPGSFGNKGSAILTYDEFLKYGDNWGDNSGRVFVTTQEAADAMRYAPDRTEIGRRLGTEFAGDSPLIRVDIDNLNAYNVRMPTEGNANFIKGGFTSGGLPERIIDPVNLRSFPWEVLGK